MPKIIGASLADHRELTRQRLFDALAQLMAEQPFDSLTMSQIAQRAGVGRTAVYNHFADKESLLLAYMTRTVTQFGDLLTAALAGEDDVIERLRVYVRSHLEWTGRYHMPRTMNLRAEMSPQGGAHLRDHAHLVARLLSEILQDAMDQGRIPAQDVRALVSLVHASLSGLRLPAEPEARERLIVAAQAFVLRGVGVPADEQPLPTEGIVPRPVALSI